MIHTVSILASGDEYGPIVFIVIAIVVWVIKTISSAVKAVNKSLPQRPKPVPTVPIPSAASSRLTLATTRPFAPGAFSGITRRGNDHTKKAVKPAVKKVQIAPPPVPAPPLAPPKPFVRKVTAQLAQTVGVVQKLEAANALRRRLVWSEILSKPLALREEQF